MSGLKGLVGRARTNKAVAENLCSSSDGLLTMKAVDYLLSDEVYLNDADLTKKMAQLISDFSTGKVDRKKIILECYRIAFSQEPRAVGCFHPSEISTDPNPCMRKMYFQKASIPRDKSFIPFTADNRMQRLVDLGSLVHLFIQENLDRVKLLEDFETVVSKPEFGIAGKTDGIVEFSGFDDLGAFFKPTRAILEIKTINDNGYRQLRKPKPEHIKQASIYGNSLGLKFILFLYYNKNNSDIKLYMHPVDEKYAEWFEELGGSIVTLYNSNVRISRSHDITKHQDVPMKLCQNRAVERAINCPFADYCFKLNN